MVTLDAILASLARIEQEQSAVHETIINRHVGSTEQLKRLEAGQMNLVSADDLVWQALNRLTARLDDTETQLVAGLKGIADGVGLAIAELRKELLGTPQRGRKHSYRGKKSKKRS